MFCFILILLRFFFVSLSFSSIFIFLLCSVFPLLFIFVITNLTNSTILFCLQLFLVPLLNLFKRWASLKLHTLTFGKSFDRRQTSLCISAKKSRLKNFTILPKLVICLAVLFLAKTNESSPKQIGICKTLGNQEFFTLESVLTGENLREVEIRHLLSLYALSKTKHTSHRSFFQFLIILSGDVSLNPGPVRHPCSSCLKPVAKNHRAILCDNCDLWAHIKCENISTKIYAEMANSNKQLNFICSSCILNQLPFPEGFMINDEESQVTSTQKDFSFLDDDMDELKNTRGLKIAHLNTNGLLPKLDYLKIMLNGTFFDIFAVSETKLDANILDDEIKIDGYVSYRLDRNRHGGGVLFYVNNQLESHLLKHLTDSKYESLWIKVCLDKTKPIFLSVVYRPPSKGSDLESTDQLCAYLKECDSKLPQIKEVFICGDFNCNMMSRYALSSKIKDLCSSLSLKQLIEEPTRVTPHSSTLLDLIMTNSVNISKAGVIDPGVSDHSLVYVIRKFKRPKGEPKIIRVRSFKNFVDDDFLRDLRNSDWSYFLNFTDLDQSCDIFNSIVKTVADKHAPFVTHKIKGKIEAWVTNDLLQAIKERNYFKKKANQTKSIIDWNNFTQKRNQVNNMKNTLKQDYFNTLLTDNAKRPKQLWKTLKTLVPNGKNTTTSVKRLVTEDGIDVTCPKGIADHFNNFFVNVGVTLASKFSTDTSKVNPPVSEKLFNFSKTNTKCVQDHIKYLKNGKATGLDGIGSRILKAGAPVLSIYLSKIFNCSLATGYVPKCWKIKRVSPVHKGDVKTDPSNFRPISILPIPMKIFEKIVHDQVSTFIKENTFLNDRQSGFRKLFSTTTAVLDVSENILEQLDKNNFVGAVLIDLKKAFDTVDHKILLKKLWCYGFQNQSFDWFESYLTDRQQLTLVNNIMSDLLHEDVYGVPQGSVLGPLLFLLYIDDIKSVIQNAYCHLYADDTIILKGASDPDSLIASLERELSNVDHWLSINKMTINTKKTEVIFFGNKAHLKKLDNKTVRYLDTPLKRKDKVKYLGVLFDEKMQWKYQIKNITQKASLKLGKIKAIASFLTPHTKKLLVNALVMPYFHYCSPAWSNAAPFRLSKINKKVVDASVFLGREDNYSIYNMLDKDISLLTFKALNNIAPNYLCSKIQMAKNCHSHNTRRAAKNHLQIPSSNTKFGMRTFAYRASKLWNDLPNELLDIKSLLKFKTSVKDFFN